MDQNHKDFRVLGLAGSLRRASVHRGLVRAAHEVAPEWMCCEGFDLGVLPYFDQDVEDRGNPEPVEELREKIRACDAVLIATAEAKDWHGMRRFRLRRLGKVNTEALVIAAGQNVKRLLEFGGRGPRKTAQAAVLRPPEGTLLPPLLRHRTTRQGFSQQAGSFARLRGTDNHRYRSESRSGLTPTLTPTRPTSRDIWQTLDP